MFNPAHNRRTLFLATAYAAILTGAFYLAYEVRFDFVVPERYQSERLQLVGFIVAIKLLVLVATRQLGSVMKYFSVTDLLRLVSAMTIASLAALLPRVIGLGFLPTPPRGMLLVDYFLSVGGLGALHLGARLFRERVTAARRAEQIPQQRIAIVGAGDAGATLAREFVNQPARGFKPVMFFDDNPDKHGKRIHGVPVVGPPEAINDMVPPPDISKVVIAMPSAATKRTREVVLLMNRLGYKVETLPSLDELASGRVIASRLRPVEVQDLLGREPVDLDNAAIRKLIEGQSVMVTGAGGSIGSELCRQIAHLAPQRLLMVEQSEGALFTIEQELHDTGGGTIALPLVGDILDRERMEYIFSRYRPAIVFHAAAHKHVFMMERQPAEAFRNNVLGTRLVAEMAGRFGAKEFVLISTDKAINPTSVMGATKRLAEIQVQSIVPSYPKTKYMAVRFGNVLGSSGSVIPIFKRQIAMGGPVNVTHPDVTRYFMTIPEAVGLVLQTAVMGQGGEIFVLDMGQPVKIVDLAKQMIELSGFRPGEDIEIRFTGLKPGEKLFEELQHHDEQHEVTAHPKIMRFISRNQNGTSANGALKTLETSLYQLGSNEIKAHLKELVREYTPHLD